MTDEQKIQMVQALITDVSVSEADVESYLALAADWIVQKVWPFGGSPETLPAQYDMIQVQKAVRLIARKGGEGEISHSENGISRTYGSVDDEDLANLLVPNVGVI